MKLIAMDMDGTLLNHDNKILPQTKQLLIQLQKQGVMLVLASGRSYTKLLPYAHELKMEEYGGYLVEVNGTAIYNVQTGEREVLAQMPIENIHELYAYFMQWKVEIIGNLDAGMYDYMPNSIWEEKRRYRQEHQLAEEIPWTAGPFDFIFDNRKGYPKVVYVQDYQEIQETLNKISITYHEEVMQEVAAQAKKDLQDRYWVGLTSPRWLEVMMPNVTKASGLATLCEKKGISLQECIAFGDGENDIEMLREVGCGIAMENAFAVVKEAADQVTASNEEEGIARALQKIYKI